MVETVPFSFGPVDGWHLPRFSLDCAVRNIPINLPWIKTPPWQDEKNGAKGKNLYLEFSAEMPLECVHTYTYTYVKMLKIDGRPLV